MKSFRLKYLSILSAIVGIMTFVFSVNAEEWKLHPSFDRTPLRIIDTPEDTYFLVHQQIYDKSKVGYDFPSLTLFRYNKNATDNGITPLVHDISLSSADIRMADYSPKGEYLLIVYNDGGIDLIDKERHLTYIDKLKRYTIPGMSKVTSVSFEPSTGDAWIGTDAGYMHVDAVSFIVQDVKVFDRGIDRICRFGDKLVALSENAAWQSNGINPLTFNEFKKISSVGSPSIMLPLDDNEFAYVYGEPDSNSQISRVLKLARFDNSSWKVADLGQDSFYSLSNNGTVVNRYESNFIPNKDGYLIYSASKAWQLYAPENGESTRLVSISLDSNPISLGSWDFSNFWSYRDRGTFVLRHAHFKMDSNVTSATATWTDMLDPIRPNAPAAFICTYMDYSPKYGMLVMNHGQEWELTYNATVNPSLLSGYFSEAWNLYSQAYYAPVSTTLDDNLRNTYLANINRFPLADPNGILIDPINEDIVISGSMFGGIMFQDISDIRKDVIRFGSPKDVFAKFPGFVSSLPTQTWGTLSSFSPPVCDDNNVIWSLFSNAYEAGGSNPKSQLKFITEDDRRKIYISGTEDLSSLQTWQTINLPVDDSPLWMCKVLPLCHTANKNIVAICMNNYDGEVILLDHKGTLNDVMDDEYKVFKKVIGKSDQISTFTRINDIAEDPVTGDILIPTMNKVIVFDPKDKLINGMMPGNVLPLRQEYSREIISEACHVNKIIFDSANRMWIATNNQGVVGVSKDRKNIIARYNSSNSPLQSDCVYGLGWNPETRSLMISTKLGLAEVFTDIFTDIVSECNSASVIPCTVNNCYNGNIEIRNIAPFQIISVVDKNGKEICKLYNGEERNMEWDLKDNMGCRLPYGIYYINIGNNQSLELTIMSEDK